MAQAGGIAARIGVNIGNHAAVEDRAAVDPAAVGTVETDDGAAQIHARLADDAHHFILVGRQLLPLATQIQDLQNVVEDFVKTQIRCRTTLPVERCGKTNRLAPARSNLRTAILILTFLVVIKRFEAALSSQRLPGGSRQPVTSARSLPVGGLHESRSTRCSRRTGIDETAEATFQPVGVAIQRQPHRLRVLREHRVLRDSWIHPARTNGAIFPANTNQTLNVRCNSYSGERLGKMRIAELRRDRLPPLNFRHSGPPGNRASPDSMASAEISGPGRLTAKLGRLQKPATGCGKDHPLRAGTVTAGRPPPRPMPRVVPPRTARYGRRRSWLRQVTPR
jgi:hypothetical protein